MGFVKAGYLGKSLDDLACSLHRIPASAIDLCRIEAGRLSLKATWFRELLAAGSKSPKTSPVKPGFPRIRDGRIYIEGYVLPSSFSRPRMDVTLSPRRENGDSLPGRQAIPSGSCY
jgi:hypothetical protein